MRTRLHITLLIFIFSFPAFAQQVRISIVAPRALEGRKAILLTREKGFAAVVHSIHLGFDTTHLRLDQNLLPELYQLQVSQLQGSLTFFFESGTRIVLDTSDVSRSVVSHSKSNRDWLLFQDSIQKPADLRHAALVKQEVRLNKAGHADSLSHWLVMQQQEESLLIARTRQFIVDHPRSYVSLYLLKNNWHSLKNEGLFEKLDASLRQHRNYRFLKERTKPLVRAGLP